MTTSDLLYFTLNNCFVGSYFQTVGYFLKVYGVFWSGLEIQVTCSYRYNEWDLGLYS